MKFKLKWGHHNYILKVYGDASGKNANAMTGAYNFFSEIKSVLSLPTSAFEKRHTRKANMHHSQSRELVNWIMGKIPVYIDESCADLIREMERAEVVVNSSGRENLRKDEGRYSMDRMDAYRYLLENLLPDVKAVDKMHEVIRLNNGWILEDFGIAA